MYQLPPHSGWNTIEIHTLIKKKEKTMIFFSDLEELSWFIKLANLEAMNLISAFQIQLQLLLQVLPTQDPEENDIIS